MANNSALTKITDRGAHSHTLQHTKRRTPQKRLSMRAHIIINITHCHCFAVAVFVIIIIIISY